jgi:hypothetical protein
MARPKKDNAEYHSHDKDMRNDPKIRALRKKFGHEGYAVYNMMLEVLTDADHFKYEWNPLNIEILSGDFDTDQLEEIITYCTNKLQLFTIEDGVLFSYQHQKRFKPLLSKRKRHDNGVSDIENPHSIVKDSIVKDKTDLKSSFPKETITPNVVEVGTDAAASGHKPPNVNSANKKNRARPENPDSIDPVLTYFSEKMKGKWAPGRISVEAEKFFNHYSANGWMQNKGKPIVNWRAAVNNWILNDMNGVYTNGKQNFSVPAGVSISSTSQKPPEEKKLSEAEKDQLSRDFMQDTFTDFCNSSLGILSKDVFAYYYNQLVKDGMLILTEDDKKRIKEAAGGDVKQSKIKAVEGYFTQLKEHGRKRIYEFVEKK